MKIKSLQPYLFIFTLLSIFKIESFGQSNKSLYLNGTQYANMPETRFENRKDTIPTGLTITLWVKPCANSGMLLQEGDCLNGFSYYLYLINGKLRFAWDDDGKCDQGVSYYETVNPVINTNSWSHVAIVYRTFKSVNMYVNGQLMTGELKTGSFSRIANSNNILKVGAFRNYYSQYALYYSGYIDELKIFNLAKRQSEIISEQSENSLCESGQLGYFKFEDNYSFCNNLNPPSFSIQPSNTVNYLRSVSESCSVVPRMSSFEEELNNTSELIISPNPSNSEGNIQLSNINKGIYEVVVFDKNGMETYKAISSIVNSCNIDVPKLHPGIYMLKLIEITNGEYKLGKLIIE